MKKFKEGLVFSGIVLLLVGIFLGVMKVMFASPAPVAIPTTKKHQPTPPQKVKLCAVGDSLTHGVGDTTNKGGYVYLIKQKLNKQSDLQVTTSNYVKQAIGVIRLKLESRPKNNYNKICTKLTLLR